MNSAESSEPANICMACESLEGAVTFSEEWVVGLYQYIFVSSFPKDALSDVPDATSAKTLADVLRIPFLPIHRSVWKGNSQKFAGKAEPYDCSVRTTRSEYVWCGEDPQPKEE